MIQFTLLVPPHAPSVQYALEFLQTAENGALCAVSKGFRLAAEGDILWRKAYRERFKEGRSESGNGFKQRYMKRISDPQVFDSS